MLTSERLRFLFQYNLWADHRTLDSCAALTNEQFTRILGSSFGSVRDTVAHLYGAVYPDLSAVRAAGGDGPLLH
jgi:uncharacterized damage-inducible protein DinB